MTKPGDFGLCNRCRHARNLIEHAGSCDHPDVREATRVMLEPIRRRHNATPSVLITRMLVARILVPTRPIRKCGAFAPIAANAAPPDPDAPASALPDNVIPLNAGAGRERIALPITPAPIQAPAPLEAGFLAVIELDRIAGEGEAH